MSIVRNERKKLDDKVERDSGSGACEAEASWVACARGCQQYSLTLICPVSEHNRVAVDQWYMARQSKACSHTAIPALANNSTLF